MNQLGAYSIVRYSNNLSDQRVNLAVIVWHPRDGFRFRASPQLDRVLAIDPRVSTKPLRGQLETIQSELQEGAERGQATLHHLAQWFTDGLEVTPPYPAKVYSVEETMQRLYERLVSPVEEIHRASSQRQFTRQVQHALKEAVREVDPHGKVEDLGTVSVNGHVGGEVRVHAGLKTTVRRHTALWRALSLQSKEHPEDQLARAKATAMDIDAVRSLAEYKRLRHLVTLQPPKPRAQQNLKEAITWLKREADEVILVEDPSALVAQVHAHLSRRDS